MDDRRVADYFVVVGLPDDPQPLEEFNNETATKSTHKLDPITDVVIINKTIGEKVPTGFTCIEQTHTGLNADLNHGSIRCPEMYICMRRGRDRRPLSNIGILYEGKERVMDDCEIVTTTPYNHSANINNTNNSKIYLTYRRAGDAGGNDTLAVVDICVIIANKGEMPPHAYCQINKNLNKAMVGSDVFVCYKKSMTKTDLLAYKPAILSRYPTEDYEGFPLPDSVPLFCLPMGATLETRPSKSMHPQPVFSTFILTLSDGDKIYGAAVGFYEQYNDSQLSDAQLRHLGMKNKRIRDEYNITTVVHSKKCICLLSHWPLFEAFKKFLFYLYGISLTGPHSVPIERHVSHFMFEVPFPSLQRPRILIQLHNEAICLAMPEESPVPQGGASFLCLVKDLGPENCMNIILYLLTEQKLLLHSLRPAVLTGVAEAVAAIIFPFHWQCPYIPLCPISLAGVLNAPCPFIVGIDSRYFDLYDPPGDVICVDLDTNTVWLPDEKKNLSWKNLPKKPVRVLQDGLARLAVKIGEQQESASKHAQVTLEMPAIDFDFQRKRAQTVLELATQEVFLRFMACLMKGYKQFLKPIQQTTSDATAATSLFDMHGFFKSRDKSYSRFFSQFMKTQLFIRFIEERSFVSTNDASLAFFDECTEKVEETKDEPKLIELDDSYRSERTVFVMPPEPTGLPEGVTYTYSSFPLLKQQLFLQKNLSSLSLNKQPVCPTSPVARRTKHEMKSAQKAAIAQVATPTEWAKCLLSNCYSLWFIHLPSFVLHSKSKHKALGLAYDILRKMSEEKLHPQDEICYRVVLQLCGQYKEPVLAVKVLSEMKKAGVHPNAVTYGYYNKAVFEVQWPAANSRGVVLWTVLRNVVLGAARFKRFRRRCSTSLHSNSGSEYDHASVDSYLSEVDHPKTPKSKVTERSGVKDRSEKSRVITEERGSAGGSSDRGYNSLSHEDAQNLSSLIKHNDLATPFFKDTTPDSATTNTRHLQRTRSLAYECKRPEHKGSIVRQSRSCENQTSYPTTNSIDSAGLLMLGHSAVDESILARINTSCSSTPSHRHRSMSDSDKPPLNTDIHTDFTAFTKPLSLELQTDDNKRKYDSISQDTVLHVVSSGTVLPDKLEENADSGVSLNETGQGEGESSQSTEHSDSDVLNRSNNQSDNQVVCNASSDTTQNTDLFNSQITITGDLLMLDTSHTLDNDSLADVSSCDIIDFNPLDSSTEQRTPTSDLPDAFKGAIPVTQYDPLGVFNITDTTTNTSPTTKPPLLHPIQSPVKSMVVMSSERLFMSDDNTSKSDVSMDSNAESMTSTKSELLSNSVAANGDTTQKPLERSSSLVPPSVGAAVKGLGRLIDLGRASSTPEGLSSPEKSRLWRSALKLVKTSSAEADASTPRKNTMKEYALERTQSLRRSKDQLGAAVMSATKSMATKFNEWTTYMSTPEKPLDPSQRELSDSDVDEDESGDQVRCLPQGFGGSSDVLSRDSDDSSDRLSINSDRRVPISNPRHVAFEHSTDGIQSIEEQFRALDQYADKTGTLRSLCETSNDIAAEVEISSCCRCAHCHSLLYDEEIMTGWSADNNNLNTRCIFCNTKLVPHLQVYVKDWRYEQRPSDDTDLSSDSFPNLRPPSHPPPVSPHKSDRTSPTRKKHSFQDAMEQALSPGATDNSPLVIDDKPLSPTHKESSPLPTSPEAFPEMKKNSLTRELSNVSPTIVPYLSPLVLRKELENILVSEGDVSLTSDEFVDNHAIIYWNMVWYFKRINVPSHLPTFTLTLKCSSPTVVWYFKRINVPSHLPTFTLTARTLKCSSPTVVHAYSDRNILVRPMWDNVRIHDEPGSPLYITWPFLSDVQDEDMGDETVKETMENIVEEIKKNDMHTPITRLLNSRRKHGGRKTHFRSIYREILFLAITACGRENIDNDAFDREYKKAFTKLSPTDNRAIQIHDNPRPVKAIWCRKMFEQLEV